jgi:hypothetical protein
VRAMVKAAICTRSLRLSLMSTVWSPSAMVIQRELRAAEPTFVLLKYFSFMWGLAGFCILMGGGWYIFYHLPWTKPSTLVIFLKLAFCSYPLWYKMSQQFQSFEVSK